MHRKLSGKMIALGMLGLASSAFGAGTRGQIDLLLKVSGTMKEAPEFQDKDGKIVDLTFSFNNSVAGFAARDIESEVKEAKLTKLPDDSPSGDVIVTTPKSCKIGTRDVNDDHVKIVAAGLAYDSASSVTMKKDEFVPFKIRFSSIGDYGDAAGDVGCQTAGKLTFSY